jgi:predicted phage-related endonuclease
MAKRENKLSNAAKSKQTTGYSPSIEDLKKKVSDEEEETKRLNVELPESLHTDLKVHATRNGTTITKIVEGLIRNHLSK